jgi:broad specificity phosphatase PhoE
MGQHTCDRRSTATEIAEEYPSYHFEDGFTDEDLLWDPKVRESNEDRNKRLRSLLDDIFATDESTYISLTAHSGAITSVLEVLGHRKFALATGAMIPVVVMVERQPGFLKRKM